MEEAEVRKTGYRLMEDVVIDGNNILVAGTIIPESHLNVYGLKPIEKALPDIRLLEIFNIDEIDNLRNLQGTEHLEIIRHQVVTDDPLYVNTNLQTHNLSHNPQNFMPPMKTKVGIRDNKTHDIIVPVEYDELEIINANQVLVNHWLLVDIDFLINSIVFNNGKDKRGYNDFFDVMYKITSGDYQFVRPYFSDNKMCLYLVKAEPLYQVTMSNLTESQLIGLKKLVNTHKELLNDHHSSARVRKI